MDWKTWYQEHLCPPQQAVRRIRSGDRVVVAHATGEPSLLLDAMVANAAQYEHVEIVHMAVSYTHLDVYKRQRTPFFKKSKNFPNFLPQGRCFPCLLYTSRCV